MLTTESILRFSKNNNRLAHAAGYLYPPSAAAQTG